MDANARHQEIVKNLLTKKAIDFNAIGQIVAEVGPSLSVADEPWEGFCGTMRNFIRLYKINTPLNPVENLGDLGKAAGGRVGG